MKVLLVDDNAFMRKILRDIIAHQTKWAHAEIIEAVNGDEAIEAFKTHKPDLTLLDVVMPGKDGIEVLKGIEPAESPVVIVSSVGQDYIIEHAKALGVKDYIMKPVDPVLVVETLNKLFPETATGESNA